MCAGTLRLVSSFNPFRISVVACTGVKLWSFAYLFLSHPRTPHAHTHTHTHDARTHTHDAHTHTHDAHTHTQHLCCAGWVHEEDCRGTAWQSKEARCETPSHRSHTHTTFCRGQISAENNMCRFSFFPANLMKPERLGRSSVLANATVYTSQLKLPIQMRMSFPLPH